MLPQKLKYAEVIVGTTTAAVCWKTCSGNDSFFSLTVLFTAVTILRHFLQILHRVRSALNLLPAPTCDPASSASMLETSQYGMKVMWVECLFDFCCAVTPCIFFLIAGIAQVAHSSVGDGQCFQVDNSLVCQTGGGRYMATGILAVCAFVLYGIDALCNIVMFGLFLLAEYGLKTPDAELQFQAQFQEAQLQAAPAGQNDVYFQQPPGYSQLYPLTLQPPECL